MTKVEAGGADERQVPLEGLGEGESLFRNAFESAGIGMALASLDGRFTAVNRALCELTGYSEAELLARDFQSITHPDDLAADLERVRRMLAGETGRFQMQKRYVRKDGGIVWITLTGSLVREADGRPKCLIGQIEDITARRQAEAAQAASEAQYRALVEASDDAIAAFDGEGRFRYVNAPAAALMGRPPEALIGRGLAELLPTDRAALLLHDVRRALAEGRPIEVEREVGTTRGPTPYHAKLLPMRGAPGREDQVIVIARDLSETRRVEGERLALAERAQRSQRLDSLGAMAGGVAHDLNNLMAVVLGHADCARLDAPPGSDLADSLDQIGDAARRAGELARQLLAVTGKTVRQPTRVGLPGLVRDALARLRPTMPRSCALRQELAPATADGDPEQLRQVLANLLLNAVQAVDRGGSITVRTGVRTLDRHGAAELDMSEGTYAFVAVRDDGCGMTPAVKERVFEPFFSTKGSGRGLGLAVVRGVARGHGGGVRVESAPGSGTEVEVLLPMSVGSVMEAAPSMPQGEATAEEGLVLVVDDERAIRDGLRRSLMRLGFDVLAFESGRDALRFFRDEPGSVAVVVLDLLMPEMDGLTVLHELRKVRPDVKVVISSGFSGPLALRELPDGDRVRFLPKPYGLDELRTVLRDVVGRDGAALS